MVVRVIGVVVIGLVAADAGVGRVDIVALVALKALVGDGGVRPVELVVLVVVELTGDPCIFGMALGAIRV